MSFSVMWTALPAGYPPGGTGTLRLSLIATPRISDARLALGNSPLLTWPTFVANLPALHVQTKGSTELIPTAKVGPAPDLSLWQDIFDGSTFVQTRGAFDVPPQITASDASFSLAHESLAELRRVAVADRRIEASGRVRAAATAQSRALDIVRAIRDLDSDAGERERRGEAIAQRVARLRAAGDEIGALAAPFAAYARALRGAPADGNRAERLSGGVRPITAADFHQVLGLLLNYPHLSTAVGLRIDLTLPAFTGPRSIRVVGPDGQPIQGEKHVAQPFSRVIAEPDRRRFTMQDGPGPNPEVTRGMLAVAGNPDYVVSTVDVIGQSLQLVAQSISMATGRPGAVIDPSLPARRDLGITVARRNRPAAVVTPSLQRSASLHQSLIAADPLSQDLELAADDVTRGFRLDVSRNGGPFRSLMARTVRTTVGTRTLPQVQDEGRFEAFTGVQQPDGDGVPRLTTGDEIASWDGWALGVPRPGFKVETAPGSPVHAAPVPPADLPGYGIRTEIASVPGSLERLRFGDSYRLRFRHVDLAGNSIDADAVDPDQVLPPVRYLRTEGAPSPTIVLRRRYTAGESLHHLVVRSAGGNPEGPAAERHLAPPNASQALVERHGMFDRALGNNRGNQGVRDEMLALGRREAGSFIDPVVPGREGGPVPARGIAIVTNDPAAPPPVTLPIPRGEPLPNGAYVIHDTDHPLLPYLADPIVEGVSLIGFPGSSGPVTALYGGTAWPDVAPIRLIVRPTTKAQPNTVAEVIDDGGRPALSLRVPPGFDETMELSSSIRRTLIPHLDTAGGNDKQVATGLVPEVSPRQVISVVHAVRQPAEPPRIIGEPVPVTTDDGVSYSATAVVGTHAPTTAQVDVEATWTELSDPGAGQLIDGERVLRVGSRAVDKSGSGTVSVQIEQLFGDPRHRRITLTPWAATRFREYYPAEPPGSRNLQRAAVTGVTISVPNRGRPAPPVVHSVVPLFSWKRGIEPPTSAFPGRRAGERTTAGLRVWLERPWLTTGEGELLGVVIHTAIAPTGVALTRTQDLVSRWGGDPLESQPVPLAPKNLLASNFSVPPGGSGGAQHTDELPLTEAGGIKAQVLGFSVQFDPARDRWFADVPISIPDEQWPFVRLAVVRYQPESRPGKAISPVVRTDFAQLPPTRKVIWFRAGTLGVRAIVTGPRTENSAFTIRQERFMPDPFDASTGLATDAGVGSPDGWTIASGPTGGQQRADLTLSRASSPGTGVMAELEAGRVVVEESQVGLALLAPTTADRVVFTETVRRSEIV